MRPLAVPTETTEYYGTTTMSTLHTLLHCRLRGVPTAGCTSTCRGCLFGSALNCHRPLVVSVIPVSPTTVGGAASGSLSRRTREQQLCLRSPLRTQQSRSPRRIHRDVVFTSCRSPGPRFHILSSSERSRHRGLQGSREIGAPISVLIQSVSLPALPQTHVRACF